MIKVRCRTNIDKFKGEQWPQIFICRPLRGDAVESASGAILHIVGITHAVGKVNMIDSDLSGQPYLKIELHRNYPGLGTTK